MDLGLTVVDMPPAAASPRAPVAGVLTPARPDGAAEMTAAFGWGALAASSLVIGAVIALVFHIGLRPIGLIMGFGAGVLISAVAFDLVEEAAQTSAGHGGVAAGLFAGCLVFFGGDC